MKTLQYLLTDNVCTMSHMMKVSIKMMMMKNTFQISAVEHTSQVTHYRTTSFKKFPMEITADVYKLMQNSDEY